MRKWLGVLIVIFGVSSAQAAKEIVILDVNTSRPGLVGVHYALWLPCSKPIGKPSFVSAWKDLPTQDSALLAQLIAGTVVEYQDADYFPQSYTTTQIKQFILDKWTSENVAFQAGAAPGQYYGVFFDGTTLWSQ